MRHSVADDRVAMANKQGFIKKHHWRSLALVLANPSMTLIDRGFSFVAAEAEIEKIVTLLFFLNLFSQSSFFLRSTVLLPSLFYIHYNACHSCL